jgi:beta-galactosidase
LLRALARKAGVHLYIDTQDIVWASHDLLAISVNHAGVRTVRLPQRRTIVNLWSGDIIAEDNSQFELDIPEKGTVLLRLR